MGTITYKKNLLIPIMLSIGLMTGCSYTMTTEYEGRTVIVNNPTEVTHDGETYNVALSTKTLYKKEMDAILNSTLTSHQKQGLLYALPNADAKKRQEMMDLVSTTDFVHDGEKYTANTMVYKENQKGVQRILNSKKLTVAEKQSWLSKLGNLKEDELEKLTLILAAEEIEKRSQKSVDTN